MKAERKWGNTGAKETCTFWAGEEREVPSLHEALMDGSLGKGGLERGNKVRAQKCKGEG